VSVASEKDRTSLDDKLFTVRRKVFEKPHIQVDMELCRGCFKRICTYICPADVYRWNEEEQKLDIRYEDCLECGACRVACGLHNIEWSNPLWGTGIVYKNG